MKKRQIVLILLVLAMLMTSCATPTPQPDQPQAPESPTAGGEAAAPSESSETIVLKGLYQKQAGVQVDDMERLSAEYEALNPGIDLQWEYVAYESIHDKVVTAALAGTGSYDIVILDGIWPAEFAEAGFILDVTDKYNEEMKSNIFPGAIEEVTYKGRYWGVPFLNGVLFFYYNEEMLKEAGYDEPPKTWQEVAEMAYAAKEKGVIEYPIIGSFGLTELLVCDYSVYLFTFGGEFFTEDLKPAFNSPEGIQALQFMIDGLEGGIYNPASLESESEEVRRIFSQGQAMFAINWTYMANLLEDPEESNVMGKIKVALMPGTESVKSATVNGGEGLAIMADSKYPDEAWDFLEWLISPDVNITYANRTLPLYPENFLPGSPVEKAQPMLAHVAAEQLSYMVNRPIVPYYTEASEILQREIQTALLKQKTAEQALADAEQQILELQSKFN